METMDSDSTQNKLGNIDEKVGVGGEIYVLNSKLNYKPMCSFPSEDKICILW